MEIVNTETKAVKQRIESIAKKYNWKYDILDDGKIRLDISLKLKDGTLRFQYIYLDIIYEGKNIYMSSRIGMYNPHLTYALLKKLTPICTYSCLAIVNDTYNGQSVESFILQAVPDVTISDDILFKIIFEVGNYADYMEHTFYGGDNV